MTYLTHPQFNFYRLRKFYFFLVLLGSKSFFSLLIILFPCDWSFFILSGSSRGNAILKLDPIRICMSLNACFFTNKPPSFTASLICHKKCSKTFMSFQFICLKKSRFTRPWKKNMVCPHYIINNFLAQRCRTTWQPSCSGLTTERRFCLLKCYHSLTKTSPTNTGKVIVLRMNARCLMKFDVSVKSQKINLLSFRRKPESSHFNSFWTSAFAGVTGLGLFTRPSNLMGNNEKTWLCSYRCRHSYHWRG